MSTMAQVSEVWTMAKVPNMSNVGTMPKLPKRQHVKSAESAKVSKVLKVSKCTLDKSGPCDTRLHWRQRAHLPTIDLAESPQNQAASDTPPDTSELNQD
jgi:hypothetical protein